MIVLLFLLRRRRRPQKHLNFQHLGLRYLALCLRHQALSLSGLFVQRHQMCNHIWRPPTYSATDLHLVMSTRLQHIFLRSLDLCPLRQRSHLQLHCPYYLGHRGQVSCLRNKRLGRIGCAHCPFHNRRGIRNGLALTHSPDP